MEPESIGNEADDISAENDPDSLRDGGLLELTTESTRAFLLVYGATKSAGLVKLGNTVSVVSNVKSGG